jgi:hypothetical protein
MVHSRRVRRAFVLVASALVLTGCQILTGLSELETDPSFDPDAAVDVYVPSGPVTDSTTPADEGTDTAAEVATDAPVDTGGSDAPPCTGPNTKVFDGRCYFLTTSALSFNGARDACIAAGGHLVTITSMAEQLALAEVAGGIERWMGFSRPVGSPIGKESFKWITGEAVTFDNWAPPEPDGSGECARLLGGGLWADRACDNAFVGICER